MQQAASCSEDGR